MKYKVERIALEHLSINEGQIEGLPANPRQWTQSDIDKIAASLKETPELFELRPIIAVPHEDTNVILAGSLRFCGARQNGDKDAPTILLPADMPVAKMKEIVIKDNGAFGAWDFDALGNEWDDLPLGDWGVPAWKADLPEGDIDVDGLFDPDKEPRPKDKIIIQVQIPKELEDKIEDIKSAILITVEQWEGCKLI